MKLFEIYKTIQEIFWEGKIVALRSEKEKANWIKKTYQFWKKELKKDVEWYNDKMQKSWVDLKASDSELKYVG